LGLDRKVQERKGLPFFTYFSSDKQQQAAAAEASGSGRSKRQRQKQAPSSSNRNIIRETGKSEKN